MIDPPEGPTPWSRSTSRLAFALLLCAVAVRPLAVSLGPILPDIQDDVGVSAVLAGLLGTVPVVCLGLFAPLGVTLTRHVRPETGLAIALGLAIGFGAARAIAPDVGWLLVLTIGLGIGMGLAGPLPATGTALTVHRAAIFRLHAGHITQITAFMNGKELAPETRRPEPISERP